MGSMGHKKEAIEFIILHTTTGLVLVSDKNKTLEEYFRTLTLKLRIAEAQVNPL
jgi:ribosomal protein S9